METMQHKPAGRESAAGRSGQEEILKEKYAELRMSAAQIKQMQQQLETLQEKRQELETAAANIDELKNSQKNTRILAPISDGMFIRATLDNSQELIVNVGGDVCVKKTADEAKAMLAGKLREFIGYQESMIEEFTKLTDHAERLEKELGEMLQDEA